VNTFMQSRTIKTDALLQLLLLSFFLLLTGMPARGAEAVADRVERVLRLRADTTHGRTLYAQYCASCHGATALGDAAGAYPALAGQRPNYLLKQLADVIEENRDVPEMHRRVGRWQFEDPQSLRDIVTWLADLAPNPKPGVGNGRQLAEGQRLFKSECAGCHGVYGEGDNPAYVPALRGQHYNYLKRQMVALATGHRNGMDGEGRDRLGRISMSQLDAVADYIARMPSERDAVPEGNPFVPGAQ
jgi:cytochrome c553